jgi:retinol dehydrogenase-12
MQITGANSGIGVETARAMALQGCRVVMACRDLKTANAVAKEILSDPCVAPGAVTVVPLDLNNFKSVRECATAVAKEVDRIDILINNAGYMSPVRRVSSDGNEASLQINWLSNVLFTLLLLPLLRNGQMQKRDSRCQTASRIVCVNSSTSRHRKLTDLPLTDLSFEQNYSMLFSYTCSKLAVALCMRHLQKLLAEEKLENGQGAIAVDCLNPGVVNTNITRHISAFVRVARVVSGATCARRVSLCLYNLFADVVIGWYKS